MRIDIATLFVEMCEAVMGESIIGRARAAGHIQVQCHNIRDYSPDPKHHRVDDSPYGGGKGGGGKGLACDHGKRAGKALNIRAKIGGILIAVDADAHNGGKALGGGDQLGKDAAQLSFLENQIVGPLDPRAKARCMGNRVAHKGACGAGQVQQFLRLALGTKNYA